MMYQESIYAHLQKVYSLSIIRFSAVRNKYSGLVFQLPSDSFMLGHGMAPTCCENTGPHKSMRGNDKLTRIGG